MTTPHLPGSTPPIFPSTDELWQGRFGVSAESAHADDEPATLAFAGSDGAAACTDGTSGPRVQLVFARAAEIAGATTGDDSFANTVSELRAQGLTDADRKYLVFVDAAVGICGLGQMYLDDRPGPDNANDSGRPMYSRVDTSCWQHAAAHELLHILGAVQNSAPNATGAGHCTDEVDVMCYRDEPTTTTRQVCNRAGQVDCNNDDYYHPDPEPQTYLATHWNVADSRFLDVVAAPPPPAPTRVVVPPSGLAGVPWSVRGVVVVYSFRESPEMATAALAAGADAYLRKGEHTPAQVAALVADMLKAGKAP